jgi:hypothetical protein
VVNAYTQTVGIYPESLKRQLRDTLPLFGAQRLTSLGWSHIDRRRHGVRSGGKEWRRQPRMRWQNLSPAVGRRLADIGRCTQLGARAHVVRTCPESLSRPSSIV